jgi:hypothetical protein
MHEITVFLVLKLVIAKNVLCIAYTVEQKKLLLNQHKGDDALQNAIAIPVPFLS